MGLADPAIATPLSNSLQATARRCFESAAVSSCDAVWDLSLPNLKEEADKRDQLRCHTSVLTVEAMVSTVQLGAQDPVRQKPALKALEALAKGCR
jgi:hypothetical protein